jgi:hypothetical protein
MSEELLREPCYVREICAHTCVCVIARAITHTQADVCEPCSQNHSLLCVCSVIREIIPRGWSITYGPINMGPDNYIGSNEIGPIFIDAINYG